MKQTLTFTPKQYPSNRGSFIDVHHEGAYIGAIRYWPAWRKYIFSSPSSLLQSHWLVQIAEYMNQLDEPND